MTPRGPRRRGPGIQPAFTKRERESASVWNSLCACARETDESASVTLTDHKQVFGLDFPVESEAGLNAASIAAEDGHHFYRKRKLAGRGKKTDHRSQ